MIQNDQHQSMACDVITLIVMSAIIISNIQNDNARTTEYISTGNSTRYLFVLNHMNRLNNSLVLGWEI